MHLQGVVDCAKGHIDVQMQNLAQSTEPVNRLIARHVLCDCRQRSI